MLNNLNPIKSSSWSYISLAYHHVSHSHANVPSSTHYTFLKTQEGLIHNTKLPHRPWINLRIMYILKVPKEWHKVLIERAVCITSQLCVNMAAAKLARGDATLLQSCRGRETAALSLILASAQRRWVDFCDCPTTEKHGLLISLFVFLTKFHIHKCKFTNKTPTLWFCWLK